MPNPQSEKNCGNCGKWKREVEGSSWGSCSQPWPSSAMVRTMSRGTSMHETEGIGCPCHSPKEKEGK